MSLTPAEQKVRKLARLPANCGCANCGTTKKFGFSTVCVKYFTFVCDNCKSSHQAISHRCKSLTMSSWSDAEAAELQQKGNDHARRTWLKNAPPVGVGGRPKEGDPVDVFKRFVVEVYERKRYYGEDDGSCNAVPLANDPGVVTAIPLSRPPTGVPQPRAPPQFAVPVRAPAPAPAPVADLLDFSVAPATTISTVAPSSGGNVFVADFDVFSTTAPAPTMAAPVSSAGNDPFQPNFDCTPAITAASPPASIFPFISADSSTTLSTPAAIAAPTLAPLVKKPVMSNHTMSEKSNFISFMNGPTSQPPGGFSSGVGVGGAGIPKNNNMNMMQYRQQQMMMNNMGMNGMNMNHGMNMSMGSMNNNNMNLGFGMMHGGGNNINSNMVMGGNNPMMMTSQQQRMTTMNGSGGSSSNNNSGKTTVNSMNSLDMNISSMNAWTTGNKK